MCCSKIILFTTNIILFIAGVFVIGLSSLVISRGNEYGELLMDGTLALPIIILIIGIFIAILGFLGCFGALRESKCMLYTYSSIVMVFFIAEIILAIFILVHPAATKDAMETYLKKQFKKYDSGDDALDNSIDNMQINLQCCGVNGPADWKLYAPLKDIPESCCNTNKSLLTSKNCGGVSSNPLGSLVNGRNDSYYQDGCLDKLIDELKSITLALGITALVLGILMFFSMATACGLARKSNYH